MLLGIVYVPIWFALFGYSHAFELLVRIGRWPFLAALILCLLSLLYRYGPCRRAAKWHWVTRRLGVRHHGLAARVRGLLLLCLQLRPLRPVLRLARRGDHSARSGSTSPSTSCCSAPRSTPSSSCRRPWTRRPDRRDRSASGALSSPTTSPADRQATNAPPVRCWRATRPSPAPLEAIRASRPIAAKCV